MSLRLKGFWVEASVWVSEGLLEIRDVSAKGPTGVWRPVSGCRFAETARQFCGGILHIQDRVLRNNLSSSSGFYLLLLFINV